ncbi:MAG: hypothetical protein ACLFOY_01330 [Desulfatibacillaceae bacterium]
MFDIHADVAKNRLYITLVELKPGESKDAVEAVKREVRKLARGFTVLNDMARYNPVSQEESEDIVRAQRAILAGGMAKAARVVGSKVGEIQFARRSRESGYEAEIVTTVAEGEALLDRWEKDRRRKLDEMT